VQVSEQTAENDNRREMIEENIPLVKYVVGRMAVSLPDHMDEEDLINYGIIGLIKAVDRFDPQRGYKFSTYAVHRIKGSIIDALRKQDWVPRTVREKYGYYEEVVGKLENKLGRSATKEEMMEALEMDDEEFDEFISEITTYYLISTEDFDKPEISVSGDISDPQKELFESEKKKHLLEALGKLPEKEKLVLSLYYYEGLTQKEISEVLDLSPSRISQLHSKAIFRMRGYLGRKKEILS